MTKMEQLNDFFSNPEMQKKIEQAETFDDLYSLVKEQGIDISKEDFKVVMGEIGKEVDKAIAESDELNEEMLEGVSGGGLFSLSIGSAFAIKASGALAVGLGVGAGLLVGAGLVAGGYYAWKKWGKKIFA